MTSATYHVYIYIWRFPEIGVPPNYTFRGTPHLWKPPFGSACPLASASANSGREAKETPAMEKVPLCQKTQVQVLAPTATQK